MEKGDTGEKGIQKGGYYYCVSDEQLRDYAKLTPKQRLEWVDQARRFTVMARTPETAQMHDKLRRGEV